MLTELVVMWFCLRSRELLKWLWKLTWMRKVVLPKQKNSAGKRKVFRQPPTVIRCNCFLKTQFHQGWPWKLTRYCFDWQLCKDTPLNNVQHFVFWTCSNETKFIAIRKIFIIEYPAEENNIDIVSESPYLLSCWCNCKWTSLWLSIVLVPNNSLHASLYVMPSITSVQWNTSVPSRGRAPLGSRFCMMVPWVDCQCELGECLIARTFKQAPGSRMARCERGLPCQHRQSLNPLAPASRCLQSGWAGYLTPCGLLVGQDCLDKMLWS